jgi:hypothetical protein
MVEFRPSIECPQHGGAWGSDPMCDRCTDEEGEPLPYRVRSTDPGIERPRRQGAVIEQAPIQVIESTGEVIDPPNTELIMRSRHLEAKLLAELRRPEEAAEVRASMAEDWLAYLDGEDRQRADTEAAEAMKRGRQRVIWFFIGLGVGLLIGVVALLGVHGKRESVAARVTSCETMTGEQAMCLIDPKDTNPWLSD